MNFAEPLEFRGRLLSAAVSVFVAVHVHSSSKNARAKRCNELCGSLVGWKRPWKGPKISAFVPWVQLVSVLGLGFGNEAPEDHEGEQGDCLMDTTEATKLGRVLVSVLVNALHTYLVWRRAVLVQLRFGLFWCLWLGPEHLKLWEHSLLPDLVTWRARWKLVQKAASDTFCWGHWFPECNYG